MQQLSEEKARVEPFTASMLDGIDMRETLRNLHEGRIYVRENQRVKGGVGSVVVIFDEDRGNDRFPYCMTWLGEHEQESDMAFYATPPAGQHRRTRHLPLRVRRVHPLLSAAPHDRRLAGQGLCIRPLQGGSAAPGGPRLFTGKACGLRRGPSAPQHLQADGRPSREEKSSTSLWEACRRSS